MPPSILRLPITNVLTGVDFTATLKLGAAAAPVRLLLDTGSSMFAVNRIAYDPTQDTDGQTTKLLQVAHYLSSSFVGGVVRTSLSLQGTDMAPLNLAAVNLTVTYSKRRDAFDSADGILGLAYRKLDSAYLMPADTWQNQYDASQVCLGSACDLEPCFDQLADAGLVSNKFAFAINRSLRREGPDPASDPLNGGLFVIGGGEECSDLYTPPFTRIAVLDEAFFNTNLIAIQVGRQPPIPAPPVAPGSTAASNSIIDTGTASLTLDQDLYRAVLTSFGAIQPSFALLLQTCAYGGAGGDQTQIDLAGWPPLSIVLQGTDGTGAVLTMRPQDYWQFDATGPGIAIAALCGDGGMLGGQSILGLPLLCGRYVVFDRTSSSGNGVVAFAWQK